VGELTQPEREYRAMRALVADALRRGDRAALLVAVSEHNRALAAIKETINAGQ
jgi:hypothetical protein